MTNPTSKQPKTVGGDVRQRLMAAALELLQSEGFQALTQARVAEVAGVRQSHLTYYFRTRNDLLKAVVEEGCSALLGMMEMNASPGKVTLAKFRDALLSATQDQNMPRLLIALSVASDEEPALKGWLVEFNRGLLAHLDTSFRQFGLKPSSEDLMLFHATMVGTTVLSLQHTEMKWTHTKNKIMRLAFDRLVASSRVLLASTRKAGRT